MLVAPWIPASCLDLDQVGLDLAPAHDVFTRALKVEAGLLQHGGGVDRAAVARLRPGGGMAAANSWCCGAAWHGGSTGRARSADDSSCSSCSADDSSCSTNASRSDF